MKDARENGVCWGVPEAGAILRCEAFLIICVLSLTSHRNESGRENKLLPQHQL